MIIVRHAKDDYFAYLTAEGMDKAGVDVFSVTFQTQPYATFIIWGKAEKDFDTNMMDDTINTEFDELDKKGGK